MFELTPINRHKTGMLNFVAQLGESYVGVHAYNHATAKQLAIEYFAPKKKERDSIIINHIPPRSREYIIVRER